MDNNNLDFAVRIAAAQVRPSEDELRAVRVFECVMAVVHQAMAAYAQNGGKIPYLFRCVPGTPVPTYY